MLDCHPKESRIDDVMRLTKKQRTVLYGLIKYPSLYDRELSEIIGVNPSTIATLRNRLRDESFFHPRWAPFFNKLGCELMIVSYAKLNPSTTSEARFECYEHLANSMDCTVHAVSKFSDIFFVSFAKDLTSFRDDKNTLMKLNKKLQFIDESTLTHLYFPFKSSRIMNYHDYSGTLKYLFKVPTFKNAPTPKLSSAEDWGISKIKTTDLEKKALASMTQSPELSDRALAEKVGMAHNTITYMRNKFLSEGIIRRRRVLNLSKSGFSMLVLSHSKINTEKVDRSFLEAVETDYNALEAPTIFAVVGDMDMLTINVFKTYNDFEMYSTDFHQALSEKYLQPNSTSNIIFPVAGMDIIKNYDYVPLVKKCLSGIE